MPEKTYKVEELIPHFEWLGIMPGESLDDFKTRFNQKYFTEDTFYESEPYKKKIGSFNGSLVSKTKGISKKFGIELTREDMADKIPEDLFEISLTKLQEKNNAIQKELEEKVGKNSDEILKEANEKYTKKSKDFETVAEENKRLKEEREKDKLEFAQNIKAEKLNFRKKDMWGNFKWGTDKEMEKRGFQAIIEDKYDFDLDEQENLIPLDKKTKAKIPNTKINSTFLNANEVLEAEGIAANVYKINPNGGKPTTSANPLTPITPTPAPVNGAAAVRTDGRPVWAG